MKSTRKTMLVLFVLAFCFAAPPIMKMILFTPKIGVDAPLIEVSMQSRSKSHDLPNHPYYIGPHEKICIADWLETTRIYSFSTSTSKLKKIGELNLESRRIDLFVDDEDPGKVLFLWDRHLRVGIWATLLPCLMPPTHGELEIYGASGRRFLDRNGDGMIDRLDQHSNFHRGVTWTDTNYDGFFDTENKFDQYEGNTNHRLIHIPVPSVLHGN